MVDLSTRFARAIRLPFGNALVVGALFSGFEATAEMLSSEGAVSSGASTGRRTAARIAAHLCGMRMHEVFTSSIYTSRVHHLIIFCSLRVTASPMQRI